MALRRNDLTVGQTVSLDQYVSSTPGHMPHTNWREPTAMQLKLKLFLDHCTKFMFVFSQVSLGAGETPVTKQTFESILKSFGFAVSNYHDDNGVFKTQAFMDDCNRKQQQITFSSTGAHHQNGVAEHSIQTVVSWARTLLLHAAIHWPEMADLKLWPFAIQKLSPLELISGSRGPN